MSHRIAYDAVAVRFPIDALREAFPETRLFDDQFLLFELGGDNNLTVQQYRGNRLVEIRVRDWSLMGSGKKYEVMTGVVETAAWCEGGGLRLSGSRDTQAETFIRRYRNIVDAAVAPGTLGRHLGCTMTLNVPDPQTVDKEWRHKELTALIACLSGRTPERIGDRLQWSLSPLRDMRDAALLFSYQYFDERRIYNRAQVSGHEYDATPLAKRMSADTFSLAF
ncbi:hypothetical protein AA0472_0487 [Acetobacter estunensis NRIC 0472]|uniref:Uncharacterized protein n=1 Tax=Acetobacter estunensis TaxID=104097 RepID=A0A967B9D8_9PROT|nr:hypothetical protein [Acetobacter estunensis]NHO55125.1 hypothetical protein [Acetobacter estunensis]GBQ21554.1 hypothetical protein AA0472_0487 [Acetobacter estunensis NRIC 0472]